MAGSWGAGGLSWEDRERGLDVGSIGEGMSTTKTLHKTSNRPGVVAHAFNPQHLGGRGRRQDHLEGYKFNVSLGYMRHVCK